MMVIALLAVLLTIWIWPLIWEKAVTGKVSIVLKIEDSIVTIGDTVAIHCTVQNNSWLPCPYVDCTVELPDQLQSRNVDIPHFEKFTSYLMPRQRLLVTLQVTAVRRGFGRILSATVALGDGLGMHEITRAIRMQETVVVCPALREPIDVSPSLAELIGDIRTRRFYHEDPSFLVGIRPYSDGDDPRFVAWHATARHGQLMMKQFGHTTTGRALIILSGDSPRRYPDGWIIDRLCDVAVRTSQSMIDMGLSVGLYVNLHDNVFRSSYESPSSGAAHLEKLRIRLGALEPIPFAACADLLRIVPRLVRTEDTVLIIANHIDARMRAALHALSRTHRRVALYWVATPEQNASPLGDVTTYIERAHGRRRTGDGSAQLSSASL